MPGDIWPYGPDWLGPIIPGWWYPPRKLPSEFLPMKNPEKKITATMNTTPATIPTHTKIEFDPVRRSSRGSVIVQSFPAPEPDL
jgi:hypothetical protein